MIPACDHIKWQLHIRKWIIAFLGAPTLARFEMCKACRAWKVCFPSQPATTYCRCITSTGWSTSWPAPCGPEPCASSSASLAPQRCVQFFKTGPIENKCTWSFLLKRESKVKLRGGVSSVGGKWKKSVSIFGWVTCVSSLCLVRSERICIAKRGPATAIIKHIGALLSLRGDLARSIYQRCLEIIVFKKTYFSYLLNRFQLLCCFYHVLQCSIARDTSIPISPYVFIFFHFFLWIAAQSGKLLID